MFKTLSGLTDNAFWRVSADTKTCGSPLYLSPAGKQTEILTYFQIKVNKKTNKNLPQRVFGQDNRIFCH